MGGFGSWESSNNVAPTPHCIFGKYLKYIDLVTDLDENMDGEKYLPKTFLFSLNKAGKKQFPTGRRSFISQIGRIVQFGY